MWHLEEGIRVDRPIVPGLPEGLELGPVRQPGIKDVLGETGVRRPFTPGSTPPAGVLPRCKGLGAGHVLDGVHHDVRGVHPGAHTDAGVRFATVAANHVPVQREPPLDPR